MILNCIFESLCVAILQWHTNSLYSISLNIHVENLSFLLNLSIFDWTTFIFNYIIIIFIFNSLLRFDIIYIIFIVKYNIIYRKTSS